MVRSYTLISYTNQRWRDYRRLLSHSYSLSDLEIWTQNLHPDEREYLPAQHRQAREMGAPYEFEYRIWDGSTEEYRWFLTRCVPLHNEAGQIHYWLNTCTDIDTQKRTEEALRQSQEYVDVLTNSSMIGIFRAEGDEIVDANATFLRMTGYGQADLKQRNIHWSNMTHPPTSSFSQLVYQDVVAQNCTTPFDAELVCQDGRHLPVLMGGVAFHSQTLQGIGFVLDNSARRELEQRKDVFLGMVSHELKTPIAALKLQSQLLRKQLKKQNISNVEVVCARMEAQLNAITRLVNELLDLSNIQNGKLEYAREMVDLNDLLKDVVDTIQSVQTTHHIVLHHTASPSLLSGDRDRLEQVFLNLLSNAIKYAPDAPLIEVELTTSPAAATISVRDQGIGIPRERQEKIFERFYRAVTPQQRAFPGLGMGLYIVAEIVRHHGGEIRVESEKGKGSTFFITLPLATSREEISKTVRSSSDG